MRIESTGLNKEELTEQFRGILKTGIGINFDGTENNYEDLNIYFYQMAFGTNIFCNLRSNINVWAIVKAKLFF